MDTQDNTVHFIDLDGTLIQTKAKAWIIDKKNPKNYIIRIDSYQSHLITSGYHKNQNLPIYYNGTHGWLSEEIHTKVKSLKNIELSDIGISYREYLDTELIKQQSQDFISYIDKFNHLTGTINILTARANKNAHQSIIDQLNIDIDNQYFVTDPTVVKYSGPIEIKKLYCIIESIVGHKIENNKFSANLVSKYNNIHFYDDEDLNIDTCKNILFYIKQLLEKSQDFIKKRVETDLKLREINLHLYLVSTNQENPFIKDTLQIKLI